MTVSKQAEPTKTRSPKAERTRARLIGSARHVFNRVGLADARVSDIVKHSRVSHGTFYTYFTSKEDVFNHVVLEFFDDIRVTIEALSDGERRTPYEAIRRENLAYIKLLKANARIVGLVLMHSASDDPIGMRYREDALYFMQRAESSIRSYQDRGLAHEDVNPTYVSRALGCMLEQFCVQWVTQGWNLDIDEAATQLTNIWARAIGLEVPQPIE